MSRSAVTLSSPVPSCILSHFYTIPRMRIVLSLSYNGPSPPSSLNYRYPTFLPPFLPPLLILRPISPPSPFNPKVPSLLQRFSPFPPPLFGSVWIVPPPPRAFPTPRFVRKGKSQVLPPLPLHPFLYSLPSRLKPSLGLFLSYCILPLHAQT